MPNSVDIISCSYYISSIYYIERNTISEKEKSYNIHRETKRRQSLMYLLYRKKYYFLERDII